MIISRTDLKPVMVEELPSQDLLVPNAEGHIEKKKCAMVSFGLSRYHSRLQLGRDWIRTDCPTKPKTDCTTVIEFDVAEIEAAFNESSAFQTKCPGCQRPLGLIEAPNRSFFFGWLP